MRTIVYIRSRSASRANINIILAAIATIYYADHHRLYPTDIFNIYEEKAILWSITSSHVLHGTLYIYEIIIFKNYSCIFTKSLKH